MDSGHALILAWPETSCKQAGAWYDGLMNLTGFSKKGYYKVGHAAIVLINNEGDCFYFDFGRYHAPHGHGRVRDCTTDYELHLKTRVQAISNENLNLESLINELGNKKACHGDGKLEVSLVQVNFTKAFQKAKSLQEKEFIQYGPFVVGGTNCSRFVKTVASTGMQFSARKILLNLPPMLTPSPMWNVYLGKRKLNNVPFFEKEEVSVA